ncbi:ZrgA family zinc uptake protein [Cupriavidus basilensis]
MRFLTGWLNESQAHKCVERCFSADSQRKRARGPCTWGGETGSGAGRARSRGASGIPLENLFGFERALRSAAEKAVAQQAMARLRDGEAIFVTSPAAGCHLESVRLDFGATPAFTAASDSAAKASPGATLGGNHADLNADYKFR